MILALVFAAAVGYQAQADQIDFETPRPEENVLWSAYRIEDYQVEIVKPRSDFTPDLTIRFTDGAKVLASFTGHDTTVFRADGPILYYADFNPISDGCAVVAFDLKAGKQLWRTDLKALGPVSHSKYRNRVTLELVGRDAIRIFGEESEGRYVEFLDRASGRTVGHHVY
jgi:hypothetical protein